MQTPRLALIASITLAAGGIFLATALLESGSGPHLGEVVVVSPPGAAPGPATPGPSASPAPSAGPTPSPTSASPSASPSATGAAEVPGCAPLTGSDDDWDDCDDWNDWDDDD